MSRADRMRARANGLSRRATHCFEKRLCRAVASQERVAVGNQFLTFSQMIVSSEASDLWMPGLDVDRELCNRRGIEWRV